MTAAGRARALPGFRLALGLTLAYLGVLVFLPLGAMIWKTTGLGLDRFWETVMAERAQAAYRLSFGAAGRSLEEVCSVNEV